jgi:toxin ParE1/3/4
MPKYTLTSRADSDLEEIWEYTDERWGRTQAHNYLTQLERRMSALAENPNRGRMRLEISGMPMSYHEGRHVIFYRTIAEGIEVLRVLHDSMDFSRHFD